MFVGQSGYVVLHWDESCDTAQTKDTFVRALIKISNQLIDIPIDEMTVAERNILSVLESYQIIENRLQEN